MVNFNEDAFPSTVSYSDESPEVLIRTGGFTKLEYASLMMAQGSISDGQMPQNEAKLAAICVSFAKAVLEEANK